MKRTVLVSALVAVPVVLLVVLIARSTYWVDVPVPMPLGGEAATNPFYATQRVAEALGARTSRDRVLTIPATDSVIVLSSWQWSLGSERQRALEQWVEAGGRLVVDEFLADTEGEFEKWSGISRSFSDDYDKDYEPCRSFDEEPAPAAPESRTRVLCGHGPWSHLTSSKKPIWLLRDVTGIQAVRVAIGRGHVTMTNGTPFRERDLFDGEHAWLFVTATELRAGDDMHFLSEDDHSSLATLTWRYGAPLVLLALLLIVFVLWRTGARFGPLAAPQELARRSLAEQIVGSGRFVLQHDGEEALHAATLRALEEAAARRMRHYSRLAANERADAIAAWTGLDRGAISAAMYHQRLRDSRELRRTVALLETARRHILVEHPRALHGRL